MMILPLNECYACACQIQVRIRKKNCKIDLGVYLSLIQVGLFLYPSKNEVWLLDVCLSLIQVEGKISLDFFAHERSACLSIQVERILV